MIRHLLLLAVVLAGVAAADGWLRQARDSRRAEAGALRAVLPPSGQVEPERVRRLSLQIPGSSPWVYERRGGTWRFPAYFGAYAHSGRVDGLLHEVLGASGTLVSTDDDDFDDLGVSGPQAVRLTLEGNAGEPLGEIWIGRGIPGPAGDESYVRRAGSDSVLHLHANPLRQVGAARPPMLDPHLMPRDERRGRGGGGAGGAARRGGLPAAAGAGGLARGRAGPASSCRGAGSLPLAAAAGIGRGQLCRRQRLRLPDLPAAGAGGAPRRPPRRPPATDSARPGWS